ncbi:4'-phosphopantetheinyl transferase B [Penicillium canariense]|uniref:4'-phosphopantetheinyl transferase B n=1 Tax=Penicillium canariense TaxID=189055 RepID=A0A9W9IGS2_9EURO|nr:4'-phosphopantetheinyl transferase B [Penicillium canariense]KAJ5175351.1 4'-phosphopantetheinyl transferase B [Penicillium canariense]
MKPLPFPLALNIGTDIVHLPRIARLLQRANYLTRFTQRILSDQEQRDFQARFRDTLRPHNYAPSPLSPPQTLVTPDMTRWLAGRFAAKEAARKAAPGGAASIGWKDVVVWVEDEPAQAQAEGTSRRPQIVYLGAGEAEDRLGQLSISHDGEYVVATVLAAG